MKTKVKKKIEVGPVDRCPWWIWDKCGYYINLWSALTHADISIAKNAYKEVENDYYFILEALYCERIFNDNKKRADKK